jgi:hypothetical protein
MYTEMTYEACSLHDMHEACSLHAMQAAGINIGAPLFQCVNYGINIGAPLFQMS